MCNLPKLAGSPFLSWKCRKRFIAWSTEEGESRGRSDSVTKRLKVLAALRYFCSVGALNLESGRKRPRPLVEASTRERAVARRLVECQRGMAKSALALNVGARCDGAELQLRGWCAGLRRGSGA